jgi:hypothetical protein
MNSFVYKVALAIGAGLLAASCAESACGEDRRSAIRSI